MIDQIFYIFYTATLTTIVWFVAGGILYMNPHVAKIYKKYQKHPSMKKWSSRKQYFTGIFFVAGFIPILLIAFVYDYIPYISAVEFGFLLVGVRVIPRLCDMWMQTSYPNKILGVEFVNGTILSFIIAFMLSII